MPWFTAGQLTWGVVIAATTLVAGFAIFDRRRGSARNRRGQCARCGAPWAARYPEVDRAVVGGHEICAPCTRTVRVNVERGLIGVVVASAFVGVATVVSNGFDIIRGGINFGWHPLLYWVPSTVALGAVALVGLDRLKRWNRTALATPSAARHLVEAGDATPHRQSTDLEPLSVERDV